MRKQVMVGAWFLIAVLTFCGARPLVALPTYTDIPLDGKVAEIVERGTIWLTERLSYAVLQRQTATSRWLI